MDPFLTRAQWTIVAMVTISTFCGSFLAFDSMTIARIEADIAAPSVSVPATATTTVSPEPKVATKPTPAPTPDVPAKAVPAKPAPATPVPATSDDKKAQCGDGTCVAPENPDRCPSDCPVR